MSRTKHTPGPWTLDGDVPSDSTLVKRGSNVVCAIDFETGAYTESTAVANARLIAAAPDLLEALERLLNECANGSCELSKTMLDEIEAAIRKARGG